MLMTITTTHRPASDLGFLLHKHPDRVQNFTLSFGTATVFYPEVSDERCTAALLLEIDQVRLVRSIGRKGSDFSLAQYVNDRSYAASSLLGVAVAQVFSTARKGRCDSRQELADSAIPLEINFPALPCRGGVDVAKRVFEPLGWLVDAEAIALDEEFAEWGDSKYLRITLTGDVRLADALNQMYILLPVLDESKHYWQSSDEVDKLLRSGGDWLANHSDQEFIVRRYLRRGAGMSQEALTRLAELGDDVEGSLDPEAEEEVAQEPTVQKSLNIQRHEAVLAELDKLEPRSVIDLGCGPGALLRKFIEDPRYSKVAGVDVSTKSLQIAAKRLHLDTRSEREASRVELFQGALTYEDPRLSGFDAAILMEVIEHVDLNRLAALEQVVFAFAKPGAVIVTTPNAEYNVNYEHLDGMRHPDHRFEWSRTEFEAWTQKVCEIYGYSAEIGGVGELDPELGCPTQMAVLRRD